MKPRKLYVKGLNSFIEEQVIDFQRLTDKGLFGIFGPTGSGKSTILDAITMALYGSISRETKEYINTSCNSVSISYEFEIGVGSERKVYIADRIVNKDKSGTYKLKTSRLREISSEGDIPIAEGANEVKNTVEKIVGLTADDFTRSVVLPQGKFSEFLKLTGKDRRNMLERIFRLEKFGRNLGDRIRFAKKEKTDSLNVLTGRISSYEERGVSEEKFNVLKAELKELLEEQESLKKQKIQLDNEYEKYKVVWELQEELAVYRAREKELESRVEEFALKKKKLSDAKNALQIKPSIDALKDIEIKLAINDEELRRNYTLLENIKLRIEASEKEYKAWLDKKDTEVPLLIQKETNLTRAIELQDKLKVLEAEIKALRDEFHTKNSRCETLKKETENIVQLREEAIKRKDIIEKRLEEIKVDPEYREKVQKASQNEDECFQISKDKADTEQKCKNRKLHIEDLEIMLKEAVNRQDLCSREIALTLEKAEELVNSNPGNNSELLNIKEKISVLDTTIRDLESWNGKKNELNNNLNAVLNEKESVENISQEINKIVLVKREELCNLEAEIKSIERNNLASILASGLKDSEPCPVCGSAHHPELAQAFDEQILMEKVKIKDEIEKEITEKDKILRDAEVKLGTLRNNESYIKNELEQVSTKANGLNIEALKVERNNLEISYVDLNKKIEEWNRNKENTEKELGKAKDTKATVDKDEVKLSENLKGEKKALEELEAALKVLSDKYVEVEKQYINYKEELKLEDIKGKLKQLKDYERETLELQKTLKQISESVSECDKKKDNLNKEISELQVEIAKITESGKEKRLVLDRDKIEINKLSENNNPEEYIIQIRESKKNIIENEEKQRLRLEKEKEERQKLSDKLLSEEANKQNLQTSRIQLEEKLKEQLAGFGFANLYEAVNCMIPTEVIEKVTNEIAEFEENFRDAKANMDRLQKKLNGDSIDAESWKALLEKRSEAAECLEGKIKQIAQKSQSLKLIEKELAELKELNAAKKELEHVCSNLDDLAKLVEGNKFVEFVAMNQLKYISMEASKRLKDITRGRYALEIDSTGNFIMRDDFNGGSRRATNTLSGGETFLTSLCLALSLSSQIQLKGSAPLEFFFLDEGFGTLDSDLLETVMGSLERLHSDKLCVGIISHVEELKTRVPIKLLVEPAEHGKSGSRVRIELS